MYRLAHKLKCLYSQRFIYMLQHQHGNKSISFNQELITYRYSSCSY